MSEKQGLDAAILNHFCKTFVENFDLEIFQFLKTAIIIYFFALMCYNLVKAIIEPQKQSSKLIPTEALKKLFVMLYELIILPTSSFSRKYTILWKCPYISNKCK